AKLNAKLTWTNGPTNSPYTVEGEKTFNASETIEVGDVEYGDYSYEISFGSVTVDNRTPQITSPSVSFTTDANGEHTVVYINKVTKTALDATVSVTKTWKIYVEDDDDIVIDDGALLDKLNELITWTEHGPGTYTVGGEEDFTSTEEYDAGAYVDYEGYRYTISLSSVSVNAIASANTGTSITFETAANGSHTVSFVNTVTVTPLTTKFNIVKIWDGWDDDDSIWNEIDEDAREELIAMLDNAFGDYVLGENEVLIGDPIEVSEDTSVFDEWSWLSDDGKYEYAGVVLVEVTADNDAVVDADDVVTFTAEEGVVVTVTFTNAVVKTMLPTIWVEKVWTAFGRGKDGELTEIELPPGVLDAIKVIFEEEPFTDDYVLGDNGFVSTGTEIEFSEIIPDLSDNPDLEDYTIEFVSVVIDDQGNPVTNLGDDETQVSFITEGDGVYTITFTNRVVQKYTPVGATGQIYKGSENVGPGNAPWMQNGIDKDPGSGSGPGRYFGGNQGAGGSYDTIYISFDYYDSNNDLQTVNGWLNLVPTSAARPGGWTFYVQVDDGYFELTLNLADRGNGGDGHRYQDVQINDLRIVDFHPGVTIPVGNQDSTLIHYDPADLPYGVGG
ncbi:MAG: hypothetical protein FWH55_01765, partial [Oscillospiraceae bacterium]|nr:hypothetical protein [Oscillospiraceae bacterium]